MSERDTPLAPLRRAGKARERSLVEALAHLVWATGPDCAVRYVNRRWLDYVGTGRPGELADAMEPDDAEAWRAQWEAARAQRRAFELDCRLRRHDGAMRWHVGRAAPETDAAGQVVAWIGTFTDVDDLRRRLATSEDAVRARDGLLCLAAHELRTPLSTLQLRLGSVVGALASGNVNEAAHLVGSAIRQCDRLVRLVDDLLDVGRFRSGLVELDLEEVSLAAIAEEVVSRFEEAAERTGNTLRCVVAQRPEGRWDRARIERAIQNLVANALQHAPGTPICVTVRAAPGAAIVEVADGGHGIERTDLVRIFDRGQRGPSPRRNAGLGLGLYVVREIAQAHGGSVDAASRPGEGAVFTLSLPCAAQGAGGTTIR